MTTTMTVADTILEQLGGGRFIAMTGSKQFVGSQTPDGLGFLRFTLPGGRRVQITLTPMDDYRVVMLNGIGRITKTVEHVYADSLRAVFTSMTGLETSLGTLTMIGKKLDREPRLYDSFDRAGRPIRVTIPEE